VRRAQEIRNRRAEAGYPFDQVWVVFDRDSFPPDDFDNAIAMAEADKIKCAWSNEAFELWYIIHFEDRKSAMSRDEYQATLTHYLGKPYRKNAEDMFERLQRYGDRTVAEAAELCRKWGIKVYAIAVGAGDSMQAANTPLGIFRIPAFQRQIDTSEIEQLARVTDGRFRLAKDADSLERIYAEIDTLERSDVEAQRVVDYSEVFAPFALAALLLLVFEVVLSCTVFRRAP